MTETKGESKKTRKSDPTRNGAGARTPLASDAPRTSDSPSPLLRLILGDRYMLDSFCEHHAVASPRLSWEDLEHISRFARPNFALLTLRADATAERVHRIYPEAAWHQMIQVLTESEVLKHIPRNCSDIGLSRNRNISLRFVADHQEYKWSYSHLMHYARLDIESLRRLEKEFQSYPPSYNPTLTLEMVVQFKHWNWDWEHLETNFVLPFDSDWPSPMRFDPELVTRGKGWMKKSISRIKCKSWMRIAKYVGIATPLDVHRNTHRAGVMVLFIDYWIVGRHISDKRNPKNIRLAGYNPSPLNPALSVAGIWDIVSEECEGSRRAVDKFMNVIANNMGVHDETYRDISCRRIMRTLKPYTSIARRERERVATELGILPAGVWRIVLKLL